MKLADISHGSDWVVWLLLALLLILSIILLSGRGSWFISGYNTASAKEKAKYDTKKLCRGTGGGMLVITALVFFMKVFETVLPAEFAYVALGVIILDCIVMIVIGNTVCKK